ncbi:DNA-3-methyladenine glycosylase [Halobacillus yeomjeoni]|uniref:DNA-3-methyladenine glycosylase family protein n=1 Tax=Halobacillus yeomjeoni TaxID=311194 RepID=UPI001CD56347|nr:DNA-3-methyladenine glycosylase [Halobacillus yeomjeoni]MCA0984117.1 DNA-3-methyladenine glycosylase [Halobacillus yeomjeoni]
MWKESFKPSSAYDFDYSLKRWGMDPLIRLDQQERWIDIPVKLGGEYHIVRVQGAGTREKPAFEMMSDSKEVRAELIDRMHQLFQWEKDLDHVQEHFVGTNLEELFLKYPGTPIVKDFHLYDCLMKTIIHQQLNMKFAYTLTSRLVQQYGHQVKGVWFYPEPEEVAAISYDSLRELQFSQRKAEYIIDTSRMVVNRELDLISLSQNNENEVIKRLVKIRGIGPWTAENWLLFGLGKSDLLPVADIGIQNAIKHHFNLTKKPDKEQIETWSKDWQPFRSYASLTLWRSLEGEI